MKMYLQKEEAHNDSSKNKNGHICFRDVTFFVKSYHYVFCFATHFQALFLDNFIYSLKNIIIPIIQEVEFHFRFYHFVVLNMSLGVVYSDHNFTSRVRFNYES